MLYPPIDSLLLIFSTSDTHAFYNLAFVKSCGVTTNFGRALFYASPYSCLMESQKILFLVVYNSP